MAVAGVERPCPWDLDPVKRFTIHHIREELVDFLDFLREVESKAALRTTINLESTGHYHTLSSR
jgi:hypothetical protein